MIGTVEAVLAIVLWGVSFISIKIALEEISPVTMITIRYTIGAAIIGAFAAARREWKQITRRDLLALAMVGFVGIGLQQLLQVAGQMLAPASIAGLLAATAPAFTLILASIFLGEKQTWLQAAGVGLALAGSAIVITNGQLSDIQSFFTTGDAIFSGSELQGSLLVLASALVWALFIIFNRKVVQDKPAMIVTAAMFSFGTLFVLPLFILLRGWQEFADISPRGWSAILFTALLCTAAAYLLNTHALKHVPASRVAVIQMLEPLVVVVTAVLVLGETISTPVAIGASAILVGIFLAQKLSLKAV